MKSKLSYAQIFFVTLTITFVSILFITTIAKVFVGEVMVKTLGIDNYFTEFVLLSVPDSFYKDTDIENSKLNAEEADSIAEKELDKWQKMYPFKENSFIESSYLLESEKANTVTEKESLIDRIEKYTTKYIWGYEGFVVFCNQFEDLINWNLESHTEYNAVIHLDDGYLSAFCEERDMTDIISSIKSLSMYCQKNSCEFLYIQEPYKISKYTDTDISGILDFSNQNADSLLESLKSNSISVLDLRELINQEGLSRQETFYRTDHHWLAESGFWASNHILNYLKTNYNFNVDTEIIDDENFEKKIYKDYFLGSQGKKVTLEQTTPDDFTLYYPKFGTKLNVYIPEVNINETGEFTLLYDMDSVSTKDYYNKSPYHTYSYGDQPIMQITNELITDDDTKILLIHDSFCDCVIPFLSLGIKYVDALDIRYFTGSVESYIDKENPDIVIVSYNPDQYGDIDWSSHTSLFDFR